MRRDTRFALYILLPALLGVLGGRPLLTHAQNVGGPSASNQEPAAAVQTSPEKEMATRDVQPSYNFRVQRNMVVVRVIVRDAKGQAVGGLRKEDFRITDNKKPQVVSSFSVETSQSATSAAQPAATAPAGKAGQEAAAAAAAPTHYLAFYFDDLYSAQDSLYHAGQAAEKFIAGLPATERVALFTSSGFQTLDFTDDRQKIHETLMKLRANAHLNPKDECPEINDYLAEQMLDDERSPAYTIVADEAVNVCHTTANINVLRVMAERAYNAYRWQSIAVLKNLESVIERLARMPGERQVMLVSDGFMDLDQMQNGVESVVDRALRARVTLSALDGAGLAMNMVETDASRGYMPSPDLSVLVDTYNAAREVAATGTLAEIADGTGGQFFHDNNDLLAGMRKILLPPEVSYVLTFSPTALKADGSFHALKVTLANGHGLTLQARKGYFAPQASEDAAARAKEEIEQAMYSQDELRELPTEVHTQFYKVNETDVRLAVLTHLDMSSVRFHKEADRNRNDVTFVTVLFDLDGKYVAAKEKRVELRLRDSTLERLIKSGITLKTEFDVKPGTYMVRQIVRDSEASQLASLSRTVEIPY
jgi:VWFA-related protein